MPRNSRHRKIRLSSRRGEQGEASELERRRENDEEIQEYTDKKIGSQAVSPAELRNTLSKTGADWIIRKKYEAMIHVIQTILQQIKSVLYNARRLSGRKGGETSAVSIPDIG
jgi:hypothetical protein